ncbi:hypothetical protein JCM4914_10000 [Streptomyces platensis subsp. malvinus]
MGPGRRAEEFQPAKGAGAGGVGGLPAVAGGEVEGAADADAAVVVEAEQGVGGGGLLGGEDLLDPGVVEAGVTLVPYAPRTPARRSTALAKRLCPLPKSAARMTGVPCTCRAPSFTRATGVMFR